MSVIIPFYRRHANLRRCLEGLALQGRDDTEVVIAAFESDSELLTLCEPYREVRIIGVDGPAWNIARTRNAGLEAARGQLLVLLDADIVVRPGFLTLHESHHASCSAAHLSVGRVLGFSPYSEAALAESRLATASVREILADADDRLPSDARWAFETATVPLPWAFCWGGNLAIPRAAVNALGLRFDEDFEGWGGEDLEWAYTAHCAGLGITFLPEAWGVHLPHPRDLAASWASVQLNYRRFLRKHPTFEVEMLVWLNDLDANARFTDVVTALAAARGYALDCDQRSFRLAFCAERLRLGAETLEPHEQSLPLLGVRTPFEDRRFDVAVLPPWWSSLPAFVSRPMELEARRVAKRIL